MFGATSFLSAVLKPLVLRRLKSTEVVRELCYEVVVFG